MRQRGHRRHHPGYCRAANIPSPITSTIRYEVEHTLREKKKTDLLETAEAVSKMCNIITVRQKHPMGLGHAILSARQVIGNEPFAVLLGDDLIVSKVPCIKQCIDIYDKNQISVIGVMEVPKEDVSKYGIVGGTKMTDRLLRVTEMVEKPSPATAPSQLATPGRYVLDAKFLTISPRPSPAEAAKFS